MTLQVTKQILSTEEASRIPKDLQGPLVSIMKSQFDIHVEWINGELWTDELSEKYLNTSYIVFALIIGHSVAKSGMFDLHMLLS